MTIVDRALAFSGGDHRSLQELCNHGEGLGGIAEHDTPAGHDHMGEIAEVSTSSRVWLHWRSPTHKSPRPTPQHADA